jgi:Zn-finger in ubiquitin-hydrolases and other protein
MSSSCRHLDRIKLNGPPESIPGCQDCLAIGGTWLHLRMCQTCGRIGCCDSSPHRHASRHARAGGHPIARSAEPGEDWCYVDEVAFVVTPTDKEHS